MKAGLANSEGCRECPAIDSQRRAPLISAPFNATQIIPAKAANRIASARRRMLAGLMSEMTNMTTTPRAEKNTWRSTKWYVEKPFLRATAGLAASERMTPVPASNRIAIRAA